jgi:hypothetical protein
MFLAMNSEAKKIDREWLGLHTREQSLDNSITKRHTQLYHYTTAAGLRGIVESQQLRATNISYLNDAEEQTGFFDRRLSRLLEIPIRSAITEHAGTASGRSIIEQQGGIEQTVAELTSALFTEIRSSSLKHNTPYTTSFCSALHKQTNDDGLLSQWRGYGLDGGYAIVFETQRLEQFWLEEGKGFHYQYAIFGDVEYYDQDTIEKAAYLETLEWEVIVQNSIHGFTLTQNPAKFNPLHEAIVALSCLHKHSGFREEAEIRIVVVPTSNELYEEERKNGDKRNVKPVLFEMKNGVLVPYILLFGHLLNGNKAKLPISKVIVGPHPDKLKRQKAVKLLLEQHGIRAEVTVSDIPYLGR